MIEVRNLVHWYGGRVERRSAEAASGTAGRKRPAVDGVTLAIDDGEFVALTGPNGSGKTTLVRHFNGLLEPDEGEVLVHGRPVSDDLVAARTAVGMTFQHARDGFVAATVGADVAFGPENLGLPREEIDRRVVDALAAVGMDGRERERIATLSGGERRRVSIAGALAMDPDHLVLDEPFAGLDWPARQSVRNRLAALSREGTGIVLVTHDLRDILERADRVVCMHQGRLVLDAPPGEAVDRLPDLGVRPPADPA